jgi:PilZ domain
MSDRCDRRVSPRWTAVPNESTLELHTGDGFRRVKARLVNISREGALLITDEASRPSGLLWIRMESPAKTDWVGAIPTRFDESRRLAVRFTTPCEDDFLLAGMLGLDFGPTIFDGGRPQSFDDVPASSVV